jgi:hypothetical protein
MVDIHRVVVVEKAWLFRLEMLFLSIARCGVERAEKAKAEEMVDGEEAQDAARRVAAVWNFIFNCRSALCPCLLGSINGSYGGGVDLLGGGA